METDDNLMALGCLIQYALTFEMVENPKGLKKRWSTWKEILEAREGSSAAN